MQIPTITTRPEARDQSTGHKQFLLTYGAKLIY
jgi:hypothetical protein